MAPWPPRRRSSGTVPASPSHAAGGPDVDASGGRGLAVAQGQVAAPPRPPHEGRHPRLHPPRHLVARDQRPRERARVLRPRQPHVQLRRPLRRRLGPANELHPRVARLESAAAKPRRDLGGMALRRDRDHVTRLAEGLVGEVEHGRRRRRPDAQPDHPVQHERRHVAGDDARCARAEIEDGNPVLLGERRRRSTEDVRPCLCFDELEESRVRHGAADPTARAPPCSPPARASGRRRWSGWRR